MKVEQILASLGLKDHEIGVYISLLEKGEQFATGIVTDTKLHRPQVYDALTELRSKKLVYQEKKGKRMIYKAASPEQFEFLFGQLEKSFFNTIEELHQKFEASNADKPTVIYRRGREALEESYLDIVNTLPKDGQYYRYAAQDESDHEKYIPKAYFKTRQRKGLERKIITSSKLFKGNHKLGRKIKVIPSEHDLFQYGLGQVIYDDKVAVIDYDSESVITIKHKKFADFQRKIYEMVFNYLPEVEGPDEDQKG